MLIDTLPRIVTRGTFPDGVPYTYRRIEGITFDRCDIYGPAVLALGAGIFQFNELGGYPNIESVLLESKSPLGMGGGVVSMLRCNFNNCRFRNIAFAGTKEELDRYRSAIVFTNRLK